jgi:hypothetical protein
LTLDRDTTPENFYTFLDHYQYSCNIGVTPRFYRLAYLHFLGKKALDMAINGYCSGYTRPWIQGIFTTLHVFVVSSRYHFCFLSVVLVRIPYHYSPAKYCTLSGATLVCFFDGFSRRGGKVRQGKQKWSRIKLSCSFMAREERSHCCSFSSQIWQKAHAGKCAVPLPTLRY